MNVPTQCTGNDLDTLDRLARSLTGQGVVVELGAWLGAGTAIMARAITDTDRRIPVHAYDYFRARGKEPAKAARSGLHLPAGANTLPVFLENVEGYPVTAHPGSILDAKWNGPPIELYVDDACKTGPVFAHAMSTFGPSFIPGVTKLVLLDYNWLEAHHLHKPLYRFQHDFMTRHPGHFVRVQDSPAVFEYVKPFDFSTLQVSNLRAHRLVNRLINIARRWLA